MVYSQAHNYLTVHWSVTASNIEEGQFGIRFVGAGTPTQADVDAAATAVAGFWANASSVIGDDYRLTSLKYARIEADGKYPDGHEPAIHDFSPIIPGGTAIAISQFPLQVATVVSLLTAAQRGRAHRGRVYMPPIAGNLDAAYQFSAVNAEQRADASWDLIGDLNNVLGATASVMSRIGAGTTRAITSVAVGTRPDVQRRRAGRQVDQYVPAP